MKALGYGRAGDKDLTSEITRRLKRLIGRSGLTEWELNMLLGLIPIIPIYFIIIIEIIDGLAGLR
jgi:tRNA C32,U32 (ribose-2'-O)-methylase TrmJ